MFRRSCRRRRLTAVLWVAVSLLFTQLALANYVCPAQADITAMAQMMASGEPCEGMDPVQPVLCHEHLSGVAQSFEQVKIPAVSLPMVVQVLMLPLVPEVSADYALPVAATAEAQPPPDPIFLSTLRLRV